MRCCGTDRDATPQSRLTYFLLHLRVYLHFLLHTAVNSLLMTQMIRKGVKLTEESVVYSDTRERIDDIKRSASLPLSPFSLPHSLHLLCILLSLLLSQQRSDIMESCNHLSVRPADITLALEEARMQYRHTLYTREAIPKYRRRREEC